MRWAIFFYQQSRRTFVQQAEYRRGLRGGGGGGGGGGNRVNAKVAIDKVAYAFKTDEAARAEVAVGTAFPGIRLREEEDQEDGQQQQQQRRQHHSDGDDIASGRGSRQGGDGRRLLNGALKRRDAVLPGVNEAEAAAPMRDEFAERGFVEVPELVSAATAAELVAALDAVLAGRFDTGAS
jgi:hypothetical protein